MHAYSNLCVTNYNMRHDLWYDDAVRQCGPTMQYDRRYDVWHDDAVLRSSTTTMRYDVRYDV